MIPLRSCLYYNNIPKNPNNHKILNKCSQHKNCLTHTNNPSVTNNSILPR